MLSPSKDRLDYGEMLTPPGGFQLDFAVGTTYSLDLDALVGASIALGFAEETDTSLINNPVFLLEALRSTGDRIALFCEGGQIHLPGKVTPLYALLERVVFQITTRKKRSDSFYPSFHPKMWLIRYASETGDVLYRFAILSRNLTFDRSWDVAFSMDGKPVERTVSKNSPLTDFLDYLQKSLPKDSFGRGKAKQIRSMMRELPNIHFETGMKEFYDYDFIPTGIPGSDGRVRTITNYPVFLNYGAKKYAPGFDELFVMSPFLSKGVVRYLNRRNEFIRNSRQVLITRASSLGKLSREDCSRFQIYILKDNVVEGESYISEGAERVQKEDIHAKVYMTRRFADTDLYLGSLNASENAVSRNVEFMIRLRAKRRNLDIEKLEKSLFGEDPEGLENPFQQVSITDYEGLRDQGDGDDLEHVIKDLLRLRPSARVIPNDGYYDLIIHIEPLETEKNVTIRPLLSNKSASLAEEMIIPRLAIIALSEFYVVSVADENLSISRVVKIPTEGIPEDRDKEVVSSVVSDKASFYRYIAFLLGEDLILSSLEAGDMPADGTDGRFQVRHQELPPLYEKMLRTAALPDAKKKFAEIDYLLRSISKDGIVPEHFLELYETFRKVVEAK